MVLVRGCSQRGVCYQQQRDPSASGAAGVKGEYLQDGQTVPAAAESLYNSTARLQTSEKPSQRS
jgi:hypothetical protein